MLHTLVTTTTTRIIPIPETSDTLAWVESYYPDMHNRTIDHSTECDEVSIGSQCSGQGCTMTAVESVTTTEPPRLTARI